MRILFDDLVEAGVALNASLPGDTAVLLDIDESGDCVGAWTEHKGIAYPLLRGTDSAGWTSVHQFRGPDNLSIDTDSKGPDFMCPGPCQTETTPPRGRCGGKHYTIKTRQR